MKKTILFALTALVMISCGKSYKAEEVVLNDRNDSVNYAFGVYYGGMFKNQAIRDSSEAAMKKATTEFIGALEEGWNSEIARQDEAITVGQNIANYVKNMETAGLEGVAAWTLNEKMLFQGLVNGFYLDESVMGLAEATDFFQQQHMNATSNPEQKAAAAITAKCPSKAKTVKLETFNDSINFAWGVVNGDQIGRFVFVMDTLGESKQTVIKTINKFMAYTYPQLAISGLQMGQSLKEQAETGFMGMKVLNVDFDIIKQGIINGMQNFGEFGPEAANIYLSDAWRSIQMEDREAREAEQKAAMGDQIAANEQFLADNKLKEGVTTTESGLQYEVIKMGKGPKPTETDVVKVKYEGKLIDGNVFDSTEKHGGDPITFPLNGVIRGWTEGLQLMPVGSKFRFFIPQELGYGSHDMGNIPPYSTLIFEVELLGIEK